MSTKPNREAIERFKASEVELVYRNRVKARDRPKIINSNAAYEVFRQHWNYDKIELQEQFKIMLLNRNSICLGIAEIGMGTVSACLVDTKLIIAAAIKANASSIILAHNHPSGNLKESQADIQLTGNIIAAAKLFDIQVSDHIIMTVNEYSSFADNGLMPG